MTVAVGRLQFSVTMNAPRAQRIPEPQPIEEDALERRSRRERRLDEASADRSRWINTMLVRAGRPF